MCFNCKQYIFLIDSNVISFHCKAGIGRTGTFIAIYLFHELNQNYLNKSTNPLLVPRKVSMKELIFYIKMKRGLSITAYQFHKLLKYEDNYLKSLKVKNPKKTHYMVPRGDQYELLKSNSTNYFSHTYKPKKVVNENNLNYSAFSNPIKMKNIQLPMYNIHSEKTIPKNLTLSNKFEKNLSSKKIGLKKSLLETPQSEPKTSLFPSHSKNDIRMKTYQGYPKSLSNSGHKMSLMYSHGPRINSKLKNSINTTNRMSQFNLYHKSSKNSFKMNNNLKNKIININQNEKITVNNLDIYTSKYRKHLSKDMYKKTSKKVPFRNRKLKNGGPHSVPQNHIMYNKRRVDPPKPFKSYSQMKKSNLTRHRKMKHNRRTKNINTYGNDFYSKTNDELEAEFEENRKKNSSGFKEKWNDFTNSFISMFKKSD